MNCALEIGASPARLAEHEAPLMMSPLKSTYWATATMTVYPTG
jgi:hypothetical protein